MGNIGKRYLTLPRGKNVENVETEELQKLHMTGADPLNSDVVVYDNREEQFRLPNRGITARRFDSELPQTEIMVSEGGERRTETLGKEELPDIRKGAHPIKQLIMKSTHGRGLNEEEIIKLIFDEKKWLNRGEGFEDAVKNIIQDMLDDNSLIKLRSGRFRSEIAEIDQVYDLEDGGYDVEEGVYPVVRLVWNNINRRNGMNKGAAIELIDRWNWSSNRAASEYWIDYMEDMNLLEDTGDGYYVTRFSP